MFVVEALMTTKVLVVELKVKFAKPPKVAGVAFVEVNTASWFAVSAVEVAR